MAKCLHSYRDDLPKTSERERKVAKNSFPALVLSRPKFAKPYTALH